MSIARIESYDDFLRVHFATGGGPRHADFHWFWLRHNSELDRHPLTHERIVCSSELPLELRPRLVRLSEDAAALDIDWGDRFDGQVSRYAADWLRAHAYAPDRVASPAPPSDSGSITVNAAHVDEPPRALRPAYAPAHRRRRRAGLRHRHGSPHRHLQPRGPPRHRDPLRAYRGPADR